MTQLIRSVLLAALVCASLVSPPVQAQETTALPVTTVHDGPNDEAVLSHPYPNPFQTRTSFKLTVQKPQSVKIEVFNLLGRRVRTLYEGRLEAGESRQFTFDAGTLPNGIYLLRATGEHFAATRQMTLVH